MLNKYLLIALGGSGEKLARYLNRELEQRLRRSGWHEGVPDAWRWLVVDVAQRADAVAPGVPARLGRTGDRIGLAHHPEEYRQCFDKLTRMRTALPALAGSLPERDAELPPPYKGAGQRPQVGHAVGAAELGTLARKIDEQMTALESHDASRQLGRLARALRAGDDPDAARTTVLVASSLGGGAGAGLVQLVVELLLGRANMGAQGLRTDLTTLLFTPDVFADLNERERDGVQANSLHTVSVMLNAHEGGDRVPEALAGLLETGGAALRDGGRAAATNFYVGIRNRQISFRRQDEVVEATAKAIGRLMADDYVTDGFAAHLTANRNGAEVSPEFRITSETATSRPASSIGYASVSLGGAELADYAAERLARAQLERFLRGHIEHADDGEREDAAIERIANEKLSWFLGKAKLRPEDVLAGREKVRGAARGRGDAVLRGLRQGTRKTEAKRWLATIESHLVESRRSVDQLGDADGAAPDAADGEPSKVARDWATDAGEHLVGATEEAIGELGVDVAVALLVAAGEHMQELSNALERDRNERLTPKASKTLKRAKAKAAAIAGRKLRGNDDAIVGIGKDHAAAAADRADASYHGECARLLRDIDRGVREPLYQSVVAGREAMRRSAERHHRGLVESWSDGAVPSHLQPARNELLLIPTELFPGRFEKLLRGTVKVGDQGTPVGAAAAEILIDRWGDKEELRGDTWTDDRGGTAHRRLIKTDRPWAPGAPGPAQFKIPVDAEDLLVRARRWVHERRGALADGIRLSIADWMEREHGNADRFADAFDHAVACAEPLVSIDPEVHERVHARRPEPPKLYVSEIPAPKDGHVRDRIAGSLAAAGVKEGEIDRRMAETSRATAVEISAFVAQPVHPVALDGLFVPIQEDWQSRTSDAQRLQFARYRRTRPVPYFVPLSPERQRAFVKGWVAARVLGQIEDLTEPWSVRPLSIWTPDGWRRFPEHLLGGDVTDEEDVLARVLESLPLALATYACKRYDELDAYMRVLDLGDLTGLGDWILRGTFDVPEPGAPEAPLPPAARAGTADGPAGERASRVCEFFRREADGYRAEIVRVAPATVAQVHPRREIAEVAVEALTEAHAQLPTLPDDAPGAAVTL